MKTFYDLKSISNRELIDRYFRYSQTSDCGQILERELAEIQEEIEVRGLEQNVL